MSAARTPLLKKPIRCVAIGVLFAAGLGVLLSRSSPRPAGPDPGHPAAHPTRTAADSGGGAKPGFVHLVPEGRELPSAALLRFNSVETEAAVTPTGRGRGRLTLPNVSGGEVVEVEARGFAPARGRLDESTLSCTLTLKAQATLRILVSLPLRQELTVHVEWPPGEEVSGNLASGQAELEVPIGEDLTVALRSETGALLLEWETKVRSVAGLSMDVTDRCRAHLQHVVAESSMGQRLRDVDISVCAVGPADAPVSKPISSLRTDLEGGLCFLAPRSTLRLRASRDGYAPTVAECPCDVSTETAPLRIVLYPAGAIRGIVRGSDGRALGGASVRVVGLVHGQTIVKEGDPSDEGGAFLVDGLPCGEEMDLLVSMPGWCPLLMRRKVATEGPIVSVTLEKEVRAVVSVVDAKTRLPVTDAFVSYWRAGGRNPSSATRTRVASAAVGARGRYLIQGVPEGARVLGTVARLGYEPSRLELVAADGHECTCLLVPSAESPEIKGRLVGSMQARGPGPASVCGGSQSSSSLLPSKAFADKDGSFIVRCPDARTPFALTATSWDNKYVAFPVAVDPRMPEEVELEMVRPGRLSGVLVPENRHWRPDRILNVRVQSVDYGGDRGGVPPPYPYMIGVQEDGTFDVKGIVPGLYTFVIQSPDHLPLVLADVAIKAGTVTRLGAVQMASGADAILELVDPNGERVRACRASLVRHGSLFRSFVSTRPDGLYRVCGRVPHGAYDLIVEGGGYPTSYLGRVHLSNGREAELRVAIEAGGGLDVLVRDAAGRPLPGRRVNVLAAKPDPWGRVLTSGLAEEFKSIHDWVRSDLDWRPGRLWAEANVETDDAGNLHVACLQPGKYIIESGGETQRVTVVSGQQAVAVLVVE
jgi:hypothetical protein